MPQGPSNTLVAKLGQFFAPMSLGKQNDLLDSKLHGDKYTQAYNGNLFYAANSAAVQLSTALATTYVGICLSNPAASTKNLAVRGVYGALVVAPAAVNTLGLITGYSAAGVVTHTTPLTVRNGMINGAVTGQGKADSACTIVGTPAWSRWFTSSKVSAELNNFGEDLQGGIIIPPGGYVAIGSLLVTPATSFVGAIEWEEINP